MTGWLREEPPRAAEGGGVESGGRGGHDGSPYQTLHPPSTTRLWPVIHAPASEARSATAPFRSVGHAGPGQGVRETAALHEAGVRAGRRDLARRQAVDRDAVLGQLGRERSRQVDDRALRGLVGRAQRW